MASGEVPTWNRNSPSIRRIMADIRELQRDPSDQYAAKPLEDNMFDWHFVIRGPVGTDFEGGVYHGRIILPNDYPFKPPSIMLLTENGRWEINTKICLSISAYHPEEWQPAWGIRTILEALISFMVTPGEGALGALDYTPQERRRLAVASRSYTHPCMPELPPLSSTPSSGPNKYQSEIAKMHIVSLETPKDASDQTQQSAPGPKQQEQTEQNHEHEHEQVERTGTSASEQHVGAQGDAATPIPAPRAAPSFPSQEAAAFASEGETFAVQAGQEGQRVEPMTETGLRHRTNVAEPPAQVASNAATDAGHDANAVDEIEDEPYTDWLLYYAIALALIIFGILYRKALHAFREEF